MAHIDGTSRTRIINTTKDDLVEVIWIFQKAIELQGKNDYKVWNNIDKEALEKDIENQLQYKVMLNNEIICVFSIQFSDPFIWREKDKGDAIYLHRMVVHPTSRGQKLFKTVLNWAKRFAYARKFKYVRMDTWADNKKIIKYYKSHGFVFVENYKTTNAPELPIQNRNLEVVLLEIELNDTSY